MGGGDLNLKKSWHPSTMKNMEKVWKAEQQDNEEKKRIAELKREIEMERDREEMTSYAMEQGTEEKKEDKKLDWMYKGPTVNRDEYLMGRRIDKQFEQLARSEKEAEQNKSSGPKNHVENECIPPSLRSFSGDQPVDVARKLQEDPLYAIKKKEMETKSQLLKNPVKLKELQKLVAQQTGESSKSKGSKKKKKKKKKYASDSDEGEELDKLLAMKIKKLKGEINEIELINAVKKNKKSKKAKKSKKRDSGDSDGSEKYSEYKLQNYGLLKSDGTKMSPKRKRSLSKEDSRKEMKVERKETKWVPPKKQKLSEEEKERRRQEMMSNASWHDKERAKNVKRYEEQEKKETTEASFDKNFVQKQLAAAANNETVASRIKSNINNIQRLNHSMNKNFARR